MAHIPLFHETIKAGFPSPAADYAEDSLDFNDLLIRHPASTYCLRVAGTSMTGAGIFPDDILVVDRAMDPTSGDIIVASLAGDFTVKRFIRQQGRCFLRAETEDFPDIEVGNTEDFAVFGVVCSIVRLLKRGSHP